MGHHRDALKLNSEHTHGHVHTSRDESGRLGVLAVATQVLVMRCWRAGVRSKPPPGTLYHTGRQTPLTHAHAPAQIYSHSPLADLFASCYRGLGEPAEERGKGEGEWTRSQKSRLKQHKKVRHMCYPSENGCGAIIKLEVPQRCGLGLNSGLFERVGTGRGNARTKFRRQIR